MGVKRKAAATALEMGGVIELVVLAHGSNYSRCRWLETQEPFVVRAKLIWMAVPGEIVRLKVESQRSTQISGTIEATRIEAGALGLTPLGLTAYGEWDPGEEFWGETLEEEWARPLILFGKRPQFEMEQVLPGAEPQDAWTDPILDAVDRWEQGDPVGAREMLYGLCRADLRCLDAHAHLAMFAFSWAAEALRHYEVGVRIGELSLGRNFGGVLPWELVDNRPFLRCVHGYAECLWRLGRFEESEEQMKRLLWLNPGDNQAVRFEIDAVRERRKWEDVVKEKRG